MKKNTSDIEKKLNIVFSKVFNSSNKNYKNFTEKSENLWDSLKGVNLLLEVEKTYGIKVSPSELGKFNSFKNIKNILESKINEKKK